MRSGGKVGRVVLHRDSAAIILQIRHAAQHTSLKLARVTWRLVLQHCRSGSIVGISFHADSKAAVI